MQDVDDLMFLDGEDRPSVPPGLQIVWTRPLELPNKVACLTLDDGPNGAATEKVLEVLRRHQVRATFFLVGQNVAREPALARHIVAAGHEVGNHTYAHDPWFAFSSEAYMRDSIERTNDAIGRATGRTPRFFRPPMGMMTARLRSTCHRLELRPVGVHFFVSDPFIPSGTFMARRLLHGLRGPSGIVVLHDGFGTFRAPHRAVVAEALDIVIPEAIRRGYRWTTPDEFNPGMARCRGVGEGW